MPGVLLRRVRTRQPSTSVKVDFANPITRGLVHASVPGVFRGKSPNLASTNFSTLYGSASPLATSLGVGANISGVAASRVSYQSPVTSGDMTLFCVAKTTTTDLACFLGVFNFGNAVAVGNYIGIEAGPVYGAVSTDSANWQIASGRAAVAGETVAIAGSFTASGGRTIYINGVAGNTNATARNPSGLNEINEGCYYGGTGAGYVSPLTGSVVLSLVFNRVLSAAEHKSLTENPWQVFAKETVPLFFPTAGATNYTLTAQGGSYNITGSSATLRKSKLLVASGGSYSITGSNVTILKSKLLLASGGSYSIIGASAALSKSSSGTQYTLTAQGGVYNITGASATLLRSRVLTANGGSYNIAGTNATLLKNNLLQASGGTYSITGANATINKSKLLFASGGDYTLTGASATLLKSKHIQASGGSYTITGSSATLQHTGVGGTVWPIPSQVLYGVVYGPTGTEYTGTLDVGKKFRLDVATGNIVMILDNSKVVSL